jgi:phage terminase small subunit
MGKPASGPSEIEDPDEASLGPAMRELNVSQRRFVVAALTFPTGKDWQIAKAAGYSDRSHGALRVCAHRLFHDEKVIAGLHEEASKRLRSSSVLAVSVLMKIARTDGHRDQLRAAEGLLNRTGLHETSEHRVSVTHQDQSSAATERRIRAAMERLEKLGRDPALLLGRMRPSPVLEGEVMSDERDRTGA